MNTTTTRQPAAPTRSPPTGESSRQRLLKRVSNKKHRSFVPSDFSARDVPWVFLGCLVVLVFLTGFAFLFHSVPVFWRGFFLGLCVMFILLGPRGKKIDIAALPRPSEAVRAKCGDPACPLVEAVKAYREETGVGLSEAKAFVDPQRAGGRASGNVGTARPANDRS